MHACLYSQFIACPPGRPLQLTLAVGLLQGFPQAAAWHQFHCQHQQRALQVIEWGQAAVQAVCSRSGPLPGRAGPGVDACVIYCSKNAIQAPLPP